MCPGVVSVVMGAISSVISRDVGLVACGSAFMSYIGAQGSTGICVPFSRNFCFSNRQPFAHSLVTALCFHLLTDQRWLRYPRTFRRGVLRFALLKVKKDISHLWLSRPEAVSPSSDAGPAFVIYVCDLQSICV